MSSPPAPPVNVRRPASGSAWLTVFGDEVPPPAPAVQLTAPGALYSDELRSSRPANGPVPAFSVDGRPANWQWTYTLTFVLFSLMLGDVPSSSPGHSSFVGLDCGPFSFSNMTPIFPPASSHSSSLQLSACQPSVASFAAPCSTQPVTAFSQETGVPPRELVSVSVPHEM